MPTISGKLGPRELATLRLLARGQDTATIARNLGVKPTTVRSYVRAISTKWHTSNRAEIVTVGRRLGLIPDTSTKEN